MALKRAYYRWITGVKSELTIAIHEPTSRTYVNTGVIHQSPRCIVYCTHIDRSKIVPESWATYDSHTITTTVVRSIEKINSCNGNVLTLILCYSIGFPHYRSIQRRTQRATNFTQANRNLRRRCAARLQYLPQGGRATWLVRSIDWHSHR